MIIFKFLTPLLILNCVDIIFAIARDKRDARTLLFPYPPPIEQTVATEFEKSGYSGAPYPAAIPINFLKTSHETLPVVEVVDTKPYPAAVHVEEIEQVVPEVPQLLEIVKPVLKVTAYPAAIPVEKIVVPTVDARPYAAAIPVETNEVPVVPVVAQYNYNVGTAEVPKPVITVDEVETKPYPAAISVEKTENSLPIELIETKPYPAAEHVEVIQPESAPIVTEYQYHVGAPEVLQPYPAAILTEPEVHPYPVSTVDDSKPYSAAIPEETPKPEVILTEPEVHPYPVSTVDVSKPYSAAIPEEIPKPEVTYPYPAASPIIPTEIKPVITEYHYNVGSNEFKPYPPAISEEVPKTVTTYPYPAASPVVPAKVQPIVTEYHYNVETPEISKLYPAAPIDTITPGVVQPVFDDSENLHVSIVNENLKSHSPVIIVEPVPVQPLGTIDIGKIKPYSHAVSVAIPTTETLLSKPYSPAVVPIVPVVSEYTYDIRTNEMTKPYPPPIPVETKTPPFVETLELKPYAPVVPIVAPVSTIDVSKPYPPAVEVEPLVTYPVSHPVKPVVAEEPQILVTSVNDENLKPYPPALPIFRIDSRLSSKPYPPALQ